MSRDQLGRRNRTSLAGALLAAVLLTGTACTSGGATSDTASGTAGAATGASVAELTKGTEQSPASTSPKPQRGLKVIFVSCGQVSPGCSGPAAGTEEAAKAMGWTTQTLDGKFNTGGAYSTALRQAIAQKPDAIAMAGIDCASIRQPLVEAKAANIPVIAILGSDCDANGGEKLFAAQPMYRDGVTTAEQFYEAWGQQKVQYLIAKLGGNVRLINVRFSDVIPALQVGVQKAVDACGSCKIVADVSVAGADSASPQGPIVPNVKAALLQHPDANALLVPFDTQLVGTGLAQALRNDPTGRKLVVTGGEGSPAGVQALKDGPPPTALVAYSAEWAGWAIADTINRVTQNQPLAPEGFGTRVVEADNAPSGDSYTPAIDFKAAYLKSWGLAS